MHRARVVDHIGPLNDLAVLGDEVVVGEGAGEGECVHFNSHTDVVSVGEGWTRDPFGGEVDGDRQVLRSYDEREVPYDLLVTDPTHMGAKFIEESGMGDELAFIPTDDKTLLAEGHDNIFVLGDATGLPTSKAGSVAHFESEVVIQHLDWRCGRSLQIESPTAVSPLRPHLRTGRWSVPEADFM